MEDEELKRLANLDDEEEFGKLVETYKPIIEKFAFQFGISEEDVADVVQNTFLKIYRKLYQYHKGKFSTWVYQITLNVARDHHRRRKRDYKIFNRKLQEQEQSIGYLFEKEEHLLLHEYLQHLDQKYKLPLILYYFHDKPYAEIALILKVKLSVVKTRIHRAKKILKDMYEKEEEVNSLG